MAGTDTEFRVPAAIDFTNAPAVRRAGEDFLATTSGRARISLAALGQHNSVMVSLLLAWVRRARELERTIEFVGVPEELRNIIDLYGVTDILPLESGSGSAAWTTEDSERSPGVPESRREHQ